MENNDSMPSKKVLTQFLSHIEQLTNDDHVFQERLGRFLRNMVDRTSNQNEALPLQSDAKAKKDSFSDPKLKELEQLIYVLQQDNDGLSQQLAQLTQSNKQLEEEKMGLLGLFKRKEQDLSQLQLQISRLNQENEQLMQNNESMGSKINALNKVLDSFNWASSLKPEFDFLQQVQAHPEISKILLPNHDENILQLIAIASQWNNVLRIWDALAAQVKNTQQAISVTERTILEHSLALFNLTLQSNQATLQDPEIGENYDYDIHQKVSGSGGNIEQVLLAGLCNAACDNVRAAVVVTR
ncbi:hypothetical protein ACF3NA_09020 [Alkanindiges sp. WGS2144]|uniref:hypothetical protein n=1 Tax=Alkanindiges sp. WGS2144 TaxID=3366808 RepID=UPI0037538FDF